MMRTFNKIALFCLITLLLNLNQAGAFTYDVDWPSSDPKTGIHTLAITINGCETLFKVKTEDLESFKDNKQAMREMISIAISKAKSGCKK
jgi:hypothetical protein